MTEQEKIEYEIVQNKIQIDTVLEQGENAKVYKVLPQMGNLYALMDRYCKEFDTDPGTNCMIYGFLGDSFTYVPYLPLAVDSYTEALKWAGKSQDQTVQGEIPELIYKTAKHRNMIARDRFFCQNILADHRSQTRLFDDCQDIVDMKFMDVQEAVRLIRLAADTACRMLIASEVEHTPQYLECIFPMNEEIFSVHDEKEQEKEDFYTTYWAEKKEYLRLKGMEWKNPKELNS